MIMDGKNVNLKYQSFLEAAVEMINALVIKIPMTFSQKKNKHLNMISNHNKI